MELSAFGVDILDSKNCFLLAETQGEFTMDSFTDEVNFSKRKVDCGDEEEHKNIVGNKYKYTTAVGVKGKIKCKNVSASTANAVVIEEMVRVVSVEQAWKPEEPIIVYNTGMESEADNVLLPEVCHSNPVDCSSFADFNEFNLCLNNILSYDDDIITESLEPRVTMPTDDIVHKSGISFPSTPKQLRSTQDPTDNWSQRLTPRSEDQLHTIFDIDQLAEDMDLHHFRTDDQIQPHTFNIESGLHIVPTSELENDKLDRTQ